ncbi:MAG: 4'-phosphopantetheinyl transferase superfamily protein [Thermodesulfobacteriota bacterium]|nr:4'-phosphopantetheinyl transferase superfamily protein [Thermodesulfobacteriota bacterium]
MTIFPVVMSVTGDGYKLKGKEKIEMQRRTAREALAHSSRKSGVILKELNKDKKGAPIPICGNYWSISHKSNFVAAVTGKERIGIDIEEIKPRSKLLFNYIAKEEEWELDKDRSWNTFFRYWTAKEAVLKASGTGINKLKDCKIMEIPDGNNINLKYEDDLFRVEQLFYKNHIVAVVKNNNKIEWSILDGFRP